MRLWVKALHRLQKRCRTFTHLTSLYTKNNKQHKKPPKNKLPPKQIQFRRKDPLNLFISLQKGIFLLPLSPGFVVYNREA